VQGTSGQQDGSDLEAQNDGRQSGEGADLDEVEGPSIGEGTDGIELEEVKVPGVDDQHSRGKSGWRSVKSSIKSYIDGGADDGAIEGGECAEMALIVNDDLQPHEEDENQDENQDENENQDEGVKKHKKHKKNKKKPHHKKHHGSPQVADATDTTGNIEDMAPVSTFSGSPVQLKDMLSVESRDRAMSDGGSSLMSEDSYVNREKLASPVDARTIETLHEEPRKSYEDANGDNI